MTSLLPILSALLTILLWWTAAGFIVLPVALALFAVNPREPGE